MVYLEGRLGPNQLSLTETHRKLGLAVLESIQVGGQTRFNSSVYGRQDLYDLASELRQTRLHLVDYAITVNPYLMFNPFHPYDWEVTRIR